MGTDVPGEFRRAGPGDLPVLTELLTELCAGDRRRAAMAARQAVRAGPAGHEGWVLPCGGVVAGFLALEPSAQPGFAVGAVDWIAVAPAARRRGFGLCLLQLARSRAVALGWRQLHASTFHTNRAALHLYIEAGFYPVGCLPDYAGPGLHYVELVWTAADGTAPVPAERRSVGRREPGRQPEGGEHRGG